MEEGLIEQVRSREVLYNVNAPDYRDQFERQKAWDEIGRELNVTAESARDSWDKLRRCFLNAINRRRKKKIGDGTRNVVPWRYEQRMSFLLPYLGLRRMRSSIHNEDPLDDDLDEQEGNLTEISEDAISTQSNSLVIKTENLEESNSFEGIKRRRETPPTRSFILDGHVGQSWYDNTDETDMFFLSMSKMTKRLPIVEQAKIKMQLCQAVMEAQIAMAEEGTSHMNYFGGGV